MSVPFSSPLCCSTGYVEDRRVHTDGINKYRLVDGLAMQFRGINYCVLAYFNADNDQVRGGNPQEMILTWCSGVPEALSSTIFSAVDILARLMPPGFHPNSSERCRQRPHIDGIIVFSFRVQLLASALGVLDGGGCFCDFLVAGSVAVVIVKVLLSVLKLFGVVLELWKFAHDLVVLTAGCARLLRCPLPSAPVTLEL